jgi:hypothetical protein
LEVKLAVVLSLKPEDEKRLHPEAREWFYARRAEIQFEVPLEELSDNDLNTFLQDDEKREFQSCMEEISKGLATCIDMGGASPDPLVNAKAGLNVLKFELNSLRPMYRIKLLLKNVNQCKTAKAKQEQRERDEEEKRSREQAEAERRRKEEEERWQAARKAVSPPLNDAKRYLNDEEYDKFKQAVLVIIEVYLEKGEDYLDDLRTFDYRRFLTKISYEKEKERQKIVAKLAAQEYNRSLNEEKVRLKALLCPNRKDHQSYFKTQTNVRRYTGRSFAQYLSSEEAQAFDKTIVDISRKKLDKIVSSDFRQFIDSKCWRSYFLLPSADYSLEGVPCLDFMFDVFAVVEIGVWLNPGQKKFGDHIFDLPWREEKGYSVLLQQPEFLGYYYLVLTPEELGGYSFWQSIPLVLLKGLLNGEIKPNGIAISEALDDSITYRVPEFKEGVTIPDSFASFLRSIGSIEEMANMGIMTGKIASIAKSEMDKLKMEHEASLLKEKTKGKDTKKAKAFQLFSEGKYISPLDSNTTTSIWQFTSHLRVRLGNYYEVKC